MSEQKTNESGIGKLKILKKLHDIMGDVPYIQKDKTHPQGWSYASDQVIKNAIHNSMDKFGVLFVLETKNPQYIDNGLKTKAGTKIIISQLDTRYYFYDIESGECLSGDFVGSGPGKDEKGIWATTTNCIKYILTTIFMIPTGDDVEKETFPTNSEGENISYKRQWFGSLNLALMSMAKAIVLPTPSTPGFIEMVNSIACNLWKTKHPSGNFCPDTDNSKDWKQLDSITEKIGYNLLETAVQEAIDGMPFAEPGEKPEPEQPAEQGPRDEQAQQNGNQRNQRKGGW